MVRTQFFVEKKAFSCKATATEPSYRRFVQQSLMLFLAFEASLLPY